MLKRLIQGYIFNCVLLSSLCGSSWEVLLEEKKEVLGQETHSLLFAQYTSCAKTQALKIAHAVIKSIPIEESREEVLDITDTNNSRITMYWEDHFTSQAAIASKVRKTVLEKLEAMVIELDRLAESFGYKAGDVDIKLFEGLRDLKTQEKFFNDKQEEIRKNNPFWLPQQVFDETSKWVSPVINNVPVHSTGAAVDIRLWHNKKQEFLDMGKFGALWGENNTAPTFSEDLTLEQKNNRLYIVTAATRVGLVNYVYEFWHFSYGDRYWSYWTEPQADKRKALYGAVDTSLISLEHFFARALLSI